MINHIERWACDGCGKVYDFYPDSFGCRSPGWVRVHYPTLYGDRVMVFHNEACLSAWLARGGIGQLSVDERPPKITLCGEVNSAGAPT